MNLVESISQPRRNTCYALSINNFQWRFSLLLRTVNHGRCTNWVIIICISTINELIIHWSIFNRNVFQIFYSSCLVGTKTMNDVYDHYTLITRISEGKRERKKKRKNIWINWKLYYPAICNLRIVKKNLRVEKHIYLIDFLRSIFFSLSQSVYKRLFDNKIFLFSKMSRYMINSHICAWRCTMHR